MSIKRQAYVIAERVTVAASLKKRLPNFRNQVRFGNGKVENQGGGRRVMGKGWNYDSR